ncbi:rab11 family-interacting protein 1-like [Anguilla rostrata]|uniref:rab11 family-interacting protein 1-like n=1 Tax=Anguilla rostrata TaxID=7938 RepID=UPI0030CD1AF8
MSFINIEDDQRWVPTHVQVTVLRGRGLRAKGKHGTSDVYTVIQVGKEKFTTAVVEKTTAPEWSEECAFELLPGVLEAGGRSAYPAGSSDLALTVMHRALIGPDVFLGHVVLPLDKVFQDRICLRNEWYKLRSKSGRKEKERGELQVTVQFTRNNLTASMFDLSVKDKPRSAFGKLKDRMSGKMRGDVESTSAIVPGGYAVLSGGGRRISGEGEADDDEGRRGKVKSFFLKGRLRRSSDVQSSTSLASECSGASSPGGSLSPTAGVNMLVSDLSNSPSEDSNHPADSSPVHPVQPPPKLMTHKRAFSDEVSRITVALPRPRAVETLRAQNSSLSRSSLCINGIHVYGAEPLGPGGGGGTLPATLGLLQKCAPLSRSLQNLARRADDPRRSPGTARRWSFDRAGKEEKVAPPAAAAASLGQSMEAAMPTVPTAMVGPDSAGEGKKQKRNLFSHGRGESAGKGSDTPKAEQGQAPPHTEERYKGWFSAKDSQNKPSQEVSPMVETSTDAPCHPSPCSPNRLLPCPSPASASPGSGHNANPFTPSPATPPISPSNPFLTRLQCNPFYEELLADQALKSTLPTQPRPSSSPLWPSATAPSRLSAPTTTPNAVPQRPFVPQRERPKGVSRQRSLPALLPRTSNSSPNPFTPRSLSESGCEWDEFEAFATNRLKSPRGPNPRRNGGVKEWPVGGIAEETVANEASILAGKVPPLPPRWPVRTPVKECRSDSWLDRAQELAVKKEACLLSQTDAASMLHRKEGERKKNTPCSFQDLLSEEKAKTTEPLMKPSNYDPSSRYDCPVSSFSDMSAALQHQDSLRMSGCDAEGLAWNHRLQQGQTSGEQGLNNETNLSSPPEFFPLEMPEGLYEEVSTSGTFVEVEDKLPSLLMETYSNKSEAQGAKTVSTATIPTHILCMGNQKSHVSSATALEPVPNVTTVHPSTTNTKMFDSKVNAQVSNKNICDSQLGSIDSAPSGGARIDNVFEINNNTDKDFGVSLSTLGPLPNKVHQNKCHSLTSNTFANSTTVSVDCGDAGGCMPVAPGPIVRSTFGMNRNAAEVLVLESDFSISTEPVEAPSSEVRRPPGTSAEGSASGNANKGVIGKECSQTEWPPRDQKTAMPSQDSQLSDTFQGNLKQENGTSNLKTSNKASITHPNCSSPLPSHCTETNESRTLYEPGALNSCTPTEDKTIGETTEIEHGHHPVKTTAGEDTAEKDGSLFKATCSSNYPSFIELLQEDGCNKQEVSEPPPKPPRLCNESTIASQYVNEGPKASQEAVFCRKGGCAEPSMVECPFSESTQKISFEDLHAKVAPGSRSQTQPRLPLHGSAPWASASSQAAKTNTPSTIIPPPALILPTVRPTAGTAQTTATPSSTTPPVIGSAHTVLPKETCPATSSLSHQESSPHPVKPLTASALQGEKKPEGRSVLVSGLEKLKSTIHPGRASQPVEPGSESSKSLSERAAQYDHLTNNEIITLLLQREAELEKKGVEFEKQGALLEKREVELKKMKVQVRDLEDYIDRLLVRIMEQTPTILQVRSRYK